MFITTDSQRPIFIPYGYSSIGKTMIIMRLIRYLRQEGYMVWPNLVFKESSDQRYHSLCQTYMNQVSCTRALAATGVKDTLLLDVINHKGKPVCYMLDQAGKHQYDIDNPHIGFSQEISDILKLPNPKIWGFIVEDNKWMNHEQRQGYVHNISQLAINALSTTDRVIFIYNKVDLTQYVVNYNRINIKGLFDSADSAFPNIFVPFEELNVVKKIMRGKYKFELLPFQTGNFTCQADAFGNIYTTFAIGPDEYPRNLWTNILKLIK